MDKQKKDDANYRRTRAESKGYVQHVVLKNKFQLTELKSTQGKPMGRVNKIRLETTVQNNGDQALHSLEIKNEVITAQKTKTYTKRITLNPPLKGNAKRDLNYEISVPYDFIKI